MNKENNILQKPSTVLVAASAAATTPALPSLLPQSLVGKTSPQTGSNQNIDPQTLAGIQQFFAVFPDPTIPQNKLLPALQQAINTLYVTTLHLPPVIVNAINRLYCFIQQQVFAVKLSKQQATLVALQNKITIAQSKKDPLLSSLQTQLTQANNAYLAAQQSLNIVKYH